VKLQWDNFLAPFSLMLWIAMVVTALIIAIHLTLLCYLGQRYGNKEANEKKFYTLSDSLLLVLGLFCQQGETHDTQVTQALERTFGFHKMLVVSSVAEQPLAFTKKTQVHGIIRMIK
jgi:hypothetical protein